ncbi:MAG: hypothetical protein ACOCP8_03580 [archaeon]
MNSIDKIVENNLINMKESIYLNLEKDLIFFIEKKKDFLNEEEINNLIIEKASSITENQNLNKLLSYFENNLVLQKWLNDAKINLYIGKKVNQNIEKDLKFLLYNHLKYIGILYYKKYIKKENVDKRKPFFNVDLRIEKNIKKQKQDINILMFVFQKELLPNTEFLRIKNISLNKAFKKLKEI